MTEHRAAAAIRAVPIALLVATVSVAPADAHRSGCHRWHSCLSDRGTYTCGDLGYCSQCPDNEYCRAGRPLAKAQPRGSESGPSGQLGVAPVDAWPCPASHPIKGNFTTSSGEQCIYHVPGDGFHSRTKPERCYATEAAAGQDGYRRSQR